METSSALAHSTMTGGGMITCGPNSSEIVELTKGRTLLRLSQSGIRLADDPTSPFHLVSENCRGTLILAADGSREIARGYCDNVDADGDVWRGWWTENPDADTCKPSEARENSATWRAEVQLHIKWNYLTDVSRFAGTEAGRYHNRKTADRGPRPSNGSCKPDTGCRRVGDRRSSSPRCPVPRWNLLLRIVEKELP